MQADSAEVARTLRDRFGRNPSRAEMVERLRQSGMTRSQVRARLQQAGYDPGIADQYFDVIERGTEPPRGEASRDFLQALSRIGVLADTMSGDWEADSLRLDSLSRLDEERPDTIEVFGIQLFKRAAAQFQPAALGPVDAGYRLGPGDELALVLTGDVEDVYELKVSREGIIVIPTVGQISVNGLTLGQLEDWLYAILPRVYSGVSRSANATTRFNLSMGKLRTNQVFVMGDVARPAAYQVSAAGTVLNALYQAGGPTTYGTFRTVEIWRGDRIVRTFDLYDYLLRGDSRADIRLEQNDRIFVPPVGPQVRVEGAVRRPAVYEIKPGETVREAIQFAGGLAANAIARRIQIDRILPPSQLAPGQRPRVLKDVDLVALSRPTPGDDLVDGDVLTVFTVSEDRRSLVIIEGEVRNPGKFEWSPGLTLQTLLERADGLQEAAYTPRALIYRLNPTDGTRGILRTALDPASARSVMLADFDSVVVFSREELASPQFVTIDGFVKYPDTYVLADGMTLKDLILSAGGFIRGAYTLEAEVSSEPDPMVRTDTTAITRRVLLHAGQDQKSSADGEIPSWYPQADELVLQHGDRVFIRRAPGYQPVREVKISGEVMKPGTYVLERRDERLIDLLQRSGGLSEQAFVPGLRITRGQRLVAAELRKAIENPKDRNNIVLESGDSIYVPAYDPMVSVVGAVNFEARVLYRRGADLDYYIEQAGGYADNANKKRVAVTYANGGRATIRSRLISRGSPKIEPGSVIFTPAKPENAADGVNWDQIITRSLTILSTMLTAVLAIKQL